MSLLKCVVYRKLPKNLPAGLFINTNLFQAFFLLKLLMFGVTPYANVIFIAGISAPTKQNTFIKSGFCTKAAFPSTLHLN